MSEEKKAPTTTVIDLRLPEGHVKLWQSRQEDRKGQYFSEAEEGKPEYVAFVRKDHISVQVKGGEEIGKLRYSKSEKGEYLSGLVNGNRVAADVRGVDRDAILSALKSAESLVVKLKAADHSVLQSLRLYAYAGKDADKQNRYYSDCGNFIAYVNDFSVSVQKREGEKFAEISKLYPTTGQHGNYLVGSPAAGEGVVIGDMFGAGAGAKLSVLAEKLAAHKAAKAPAEDMAEPDFGY